MTGDESFETEDDGGEIFKFGEGSEITGKAVVELLFEVGRGGFFAAPLQETLHFAREFQELMFDRARGRPAHGDGHVGEKGLIGCVEVVDASLIDRLGDGIWKGAGMHCVGGIANIVVMHRPAAAGEHIEGGDKALHDVVSMGG